MYGPRPQARIVAIFFRFKKPVLMTPERKLAAPTATHRDLRVALLRNGEKTAALDIDRGRATDDRHSCGSRSVT
jgi:hypothetical protein